MTNKISEEKIQSLEEKLKYKELVWINSKEVDTQKERYRTERYYSPEWHGQKRSAERMKRKLQRVHEPIAYRCIFRPAWGNADSETWNFRYYPKSARIVLRDSYLYNFDKIKERSIFIYTANAKSLRSIYNFLFTGADYYLPVMCFEAMIDVYLHKRKLIKK